MLTLKWVKCGDDGHWCSLDNLTLDGITAEGVYVIWHEGNPGHVVRIGQGDVAARLAAHRRDPEITACRRSGTLRVTWASVSAALRDGVETYLATEYPPLIGDAFPDVVPIQVNAPW
jgi:hypothetical protein